MIASKHLTDVPVPGFTSHVQDGYVQPRTEKQRRPAGPEFQKEVGKLDLDTRFFFGGGVHRRKTSHYDNFVCVLETITIISNGFGETRKITVHENRRKSPEIAGNRRKSPATLVLAIAVKKRSILLDNPVCVNHLKIRHRERQPENESAPVGPEFEKEVGKLDLDARFFLGGGSPVKKRFITITLSSCSRPLR